MFVFSLTVLSSILIISTIIVISYLQIRKNNQKTRTAVTDLYKLRSDFSVKQKIYDLYQPVFGAFSRTVRKSQALIAAEEFKEQFKLGRYIILYSDRNMFLPGIGIGFKLKSIKPIKADFIRKIIRSEGWNENQHNGDHSGISLGKDHYQSLARMANLPSKIDSPFIFYYKHKDQQALFIGEDIENELARNCIAGDFNRVVWPLFFEIYRNNSNVKKQLDRIKTLQGENRKASHNLNELNRKLKHKIIDLHSFFEISNKMFTIYDKERLIESYINSVKSILNPASIVILTHDNKDKKLYKVTAAHGDLPLENNKLELSAKSKIYRLLNSNNRALLLPAVSSGLPEPDSFIDEALANGLTVMEKLQAGSEIYGIVLIGLKKYVTAYDEADLEVFSTLSNMASLALGNIHQYLLIEKMSYTDSMTELYNYRYFYKRLKEEIFRSKRFNRILALVIFDIDNFKVFNDTYGHQAGDEVLKNLAELVTSSVRAIDIVSRYGGEEFCVIMPETGFANCLIFLERLRKKIENYGFASKYVENGYKISISIGGSVYPIDAQTPDRLIYCADMALLKAKADGRNRSMMFNSAMLEDEELKKNSQQQLTDMRIHEDI